MGVTPDRLAQQLTDSGQLGSVVADVLRSKALTLIAERATVTDESGHAGGHHWPITGAARRTGDGRGATAEDDGERR